ncbi:MAG: SLBB domain-containing protein [Gemmatimonadota bacterium]|nr:SLBB domain-containing protein [Gemmatimonadota bacterium]
MIFRAHFSCILILVIVGLGGSSHALAQSATVPQDGHTFATRSELEAQASAAAGKGDAAAAYLIHQRLDHGDFREGDRIALKVQGGGGFADTLVVRAGNQLPLPQMGVLSLEGVLRSELGSQLTAFVGKFLRDPIVQANPLVRLAILGSVSHPGYYYAAADLPLSDVLMSAGGPTPNADFAKVSIRREGKVIVNEANTSTALADGMSLDRLNLQEGDEISVGSRRDLNWQIIVPTLTGIVGLWITYSQLHRH